MSKWKKQKGGYSVILNYLSKSVRVDEQVSADDVTLKCVYSYLFTSVHLVIELLRLVVNLGGVFLPAVPPPTSGGAAPGPQTSSF